MPGIELVLSGTSQVCCVHDREKRRLKTPDDCLRLLPVQDPLRSLPIPYWKTCACCDNVFPDFDDVPRLCPGCRRPNVHKLEAAVNDPIEGVL